MHTMVTVVNIAFHLLPNSSGTHGHQHWPWTTLNVSNIGLITTIPMHMRTHTYIIIIIIIIIIIYFPSVDPYRITKSKWIWNSSHFRENKVYNHYKVYIT